MSLPKDGGDLGQPAAPGASGRPREGSRDIRKEGKIVSVPDDWCKSADAPVPYPIWAWQSDAAHLANTVRQTDCRSHVQGSIVNECYGDEPGTGGGVISGTHNATCTPKTWSATVRFEGRNAVRHDDEWWMNNKNTWGRLAYTKDMSTQSTPAPRVIDPKMQLAFNQTQGTVSDAGTQMAQALPFEMPLEEFIPRLGPRLAPRISPRLAPELGPEPGPETQPGPYPIPPRLRISGCRREEICFDAGKYDEKEYRRQLKLQQDAINKKPACKNVEDIQRFDNQSEQGKKDQRKRADEYRDNVFMRKFLRDNPGISMQGQAALHRLDMVAGGNETDFAGIGDSNINSSIGPAWRAESRKGKLKTYAADMCAKGCRMSVTLDICETPEYSLEPETA